MQPLSIFSGVSSTDVADVLGGRSRQHEGKSRALALDTLHSHLSPVRSNDPLEFVAPGRHSHTQVLHLTLDGVHADERWED